jgi:hypothetical protein
MTAIKLKPLFTHIAAIVATVGYAATDIAHAEPPPATTTAPVTAPGKLTATFANGMIVELHSIYSTVDKTWWDPFGTPLHSGLYDPAAQGNRSDSLEYYLTLSAGPERNWNATNIRWTAGDAPVGFAGVKYNGAVNAPNRKGIRLINMNRHRPGTTNIKLSFSLEDERTHALLVPAHDDSATDEVPGLGEVELSDPHEVEGRGAVTAVIPQPPEGMQVIVTARRERKADTPVTPIFALNRADAIGGTNNGRKTIVFDAPLSAIRSFEVRVRSYDQWAEFRDVSLRSGTRSAAAVATSDDAKPKVGAEQP